MALTPLPIDSHLPDILEALGEHNALVLSAPPGTGKTTRLPPALLKAPFMEGKSVVVLEPRRIAARAAARRVAEETGTPLGGLVGYHVRMDKKAGKDTRLLFCTEGILTARLRSDPFLEGVGAVVLDEFHERSLEADLAIAFLREIQREVRPDLRIIAASATLETGAVAGFLGAAKIELDTPIYPVEVSHIEKPVTGRLEDAVASGVKSLWHRRPSQRGDLLVFLPGAREIRLAQKALEEWAKTHYVELVPLHGDLPPELQDKALKKSVGERVILATNVAETSLTIESVTGVVDSGLVKVTEFDPASGLDRLLTVRASRASATQRAGRAGRTGPGVALRLWTRHDDLSLPSRIPPEVTRVDLCRAVLEIISFGHPDPANFGWFEKPERERLDSATALLRELGAVDAKGKVTEEGQKLLGLPLHPRLGKLLLESAKAGLARESALIAALLEERDIFRAGGTFREQGAPRSGSLAHDSDLLLRLEALEQFGEGRRSFGGEELNAGAALQVLRSARRLEELVKTPEGRASTDPETLLRLIFLAFPDRVALRRENTRDRYLLAGGRGAVLDKASAVAGSDFIVALSVDSGARGERSEALIRLASAIKPEWLRETGLVDRKIETFWDAEKERALSNAIESYLGLVISQKPSPVDPETASKLLSERAKAGFDRAFTQGDAAQNLIARMNFLAKHLANFRGFDEERKEKLVEEACFGKSSFAELRKENLAQLILSSLDRGERETLRKNAPERVLVPSGREVNLDYSGEAGPILPVKLQELFGLKELPKVAGGKVSVVAHILGPHGRPLQVTSDIGGFWTNSYPQIRKEMRGRYPRHNWPEDPLAEAPSVRSLKKRPEK
ncbi:ATP-dependent helicase HrpB [bacterium]|nr:MAG: ATP-dependent helicase HrpB [bacterium]